jgi:hypothetical protein
LHRDYPTYYFLEEDMPHWYLRAGETTESQITYSVFLAGSTQGSATLHKTGPLSGLATLEFEAMDAWFEEDEQIFIHPKDPYKVCTTLSKESYIDCCCDYNY